MSLLQQLIDYLSQPPDSIVYHIVTLLALQATLGLAWWQIQNRPEDQFARRLAWASGAILLSRLLILLALFATSGLVDAVAVLPPLERASDALAVALLVWALAPQSKNLPQLGNALLLIIFVVIAVMYVAFASEWRTMVAGGLAGNGYIATQQADIWSIIQMALLALGGALVTYARDSQWSLRLAILIVLFAAQGLSLVLGENFGPRNVEVAFWIRLGNVIAFPMLAVMAYRHNLQYLLPSSRLNRPGVEQLAQLLDQSGQVSASLQPKQTLDDALRMVPNFLPARMVAIVQAVDGRPQHLQISARDMGDREHPQEASPATRTWVLRRDDWPGLSVAFSDKRQVELVPDGVGARQLHELNQELKIANNGALLIQPLVLDERGIGLLLLAREDARAAWTEDEKALIKVLGPFLAQSLNNAQRYQMALAGRAPDFERETAALKAEREQIIQQRDEAIDQATQLGDELALARERLDADHRRLRETTQALALAVQRQTKVRQLEEELAGIREALSEAELALAYAAAGEAGLSTEWVMRTVTRYSGELEEAQAQIRALEARLNQPDAMDMLERMADTAGRLRTPLTALGGYTDLLLERTTDEITPQQESLLRRMRVNVDSMALTLDSLTAVARSGATGQIAEARIKVHEAIDEAIYAVSADLQVKKLRADIYIEDDLPALTDPDNSLHGLLVKFLSAACLVSAPDGHLQISAERIPCGNESSSEVDHSDYLRLSISDDGGTRSHTLYTGTIIDQQALRQDLSSVETVELAQILESVSLIASSRGGRSWLDLATARGSKLVLLLPLPIVHSDTSD